MAFYRFNRNSRPNVQSLRLVILIVVMAVVQFISDAQAQGDDPGAVTQALSLMLPKLWAGEWWRLLSVTLVHGDALHVFLNAYSLWILGTLLEPLIGGRNFLLVYFFSALGGSIAIALFGEIMVPTVGASGAVYGLMGALIGYMYARFGSLRNMWTVPFSRMLLILLVINIVFSVLSPGVSLLGHLGGLVVGLLSGYALARMASGSMSQLERLTLLLVQIVVLLGAVYSVFPVNRGGYWTMQAAQSLHLQAERHVSWVSLTPRDDTPLTDEDIMEARSALAHKAFDFDESEALRTIRKMLESLLAHAQPGINAQSLINAHKGLTLPDPLPAPPAEHDPTPAVF